MTVLLLTVAQVFESSTLKQTLVGSSFYVTVLLSNGDYQEISLRHSHPSQPSDKDDAPSEDFRSPMNTSAGGFKERPKGMSPDSHASGTKKRMQRVCRVGKIRGNHRDTHFCKTCKVPLCNGDCFRVYNSQPSYYRYRMNRRKK
jgi:hypothetical protein